MNRQEVIRLRKLQRDILNGGIMSNNTQLSIRMADLIEKRIEKCLK